MYINYYCYHQSKIMYKWDEKEKDKGKGEEITTGSLDV
jgi:hypothetical protein